MQRFLLLALLVGAVFTATPAHAKWSPGNGDGPCSGWFSYVRPSMGSTEVHRRTQLEIRCATAWAGISAATPLYIADRESSFWPWALNPSGCAGVFQHQLRYWPSRVRTFVHRDWYSRWRWQQGISAFDMRANVLVAIEMMRSGGFGPWTTRIMKEGT